MDVLGLLIIAGLVLIALRALFLIVGGAATKSVSRRMKASPLGVAVAESVDRAGRFDGTADSRAKARKSYMDLAALCYFSQGKPWKDVEAAADEFAAQPTAAAPEGPILLQAAFALANSMDALDLEGALGSDRAINDVSSSMLISMYGGFADRCRKLHWEGPEHIFQVFAYTFYLLQSHASHEGLLP